MDEVNEKLIKGKERIAKVGRSMRGRNIPVATGPRLPLGQHEVKDWPVLDLGIQPEIPLDKWSLNIEGLVENPKLLTWPDFMALPQIEKIADFHCVTTWSRFDNHWQGVAFKTICNLVKPKPGARFVLFTGYDGYSTNLPLDLALDDALIVHQWEGKPIEREHGGPVRVVVSKVYAWKGAKWVKDIIFLPQDHPGFWEVRGYSNTADPWTEDRFS
jgi:DMSO/TMAO reductase YedYZ molybdopterin-dependent catalytic subunit